MTDQQAQPAPPPAATPGGPVDWLRQLAMHELPKQMRRIKGSKPSLEALQSEMHGTVLSFVRDLAGWLLGFRDDLGNQLRHMGEGLDDHEERLLVHDGMLEALMGGASLSDETQLTAEDSDDLIKLAAAARFLAEEQLKLPEQTADGKQKLADIVARAQRWEQLAVERRLEDDEDDEDEPEDGAPPPAASVPAAEGTN